MIQTVYIGSVSACFELASERPYYHEEPYRVFLNGTEISAAAEKNVFSLFSLRAGTAYELRVECGNSAETLMFTTETERLAVSVKDFGAAGDGERDDTAAVQNAAAFLPEGGRLYFPAGTYLVRPLFLKSGLTIELSEDAVLKADPEIAHYPILPGLVSDLGGDPDGVCFSSLEGTEQPAYQSLLTAQYAHDIRIVGQGRIDGNGALSGFWEKWQELPAARPQLVFFNRCENIVFHGVRFSNSPCWHLHPYFCRNVSFLDIEVTAPKDSPNTDAMDPESCTDLRAIGCRFSVGDDCIAIKSGKIDQGNKYRTAASGHVIRNCLMEYGHGAVTLGSEISAGVRDLTVSHCLFRHTDRGLRIKTRRGRGENCVIDGVTFSDIVMENVLNPIVINMWYNCVDPDRHSAYAQGRNPLPVDARTPHLGTFVFRNMVCLDTEMSACYADGLPEMPVGSVTLENIRCTYKADARAGLPAMEDNRPERRKLGLYFENVREVVLKNIELDGVSGDAVITENCGQLRTENIHVK